MRDEDGRAGVNGSVGNRCQGHCVLGTIDEDKGMNGVGRKGVKKMWMLVSGVVDRNVWRYESMALAVGAARVA